MLFQTHITVFYGAQKRDLTMVKLLFYIKTNGDLGIISFKNDKKRKVPQTQ